MSAISRLYLRKGMEVKDLAKRCNLDPVYVYRALKRAVHGHDCRATKSLLENALTRDVVEAYKSGLSYTEVSRRLGVSASTVRKVYLASGNKARTNRVYFK